VEPTVTASSFPTAPGPRRSGRTITVTVRGTVSSARLEVRLLHAIELPVGRIRVDLSGVDVIDAAGIEVLRHALTAAETRGVVLTIDPPSPPVQRLLDASGFDLAR